MEALKTWLADADPGALMLFGFLALVILLSVYSFRHWANRRKALEEMMPKLGFRQIEEPDDDLVPEEMRIAAHDGVWYLSRGSSREEPRQMESFLREGGFLLSALLSESPNS